MKQTCTIAGVYITIGNSHSSTSYYISCINCCSIQRHCLTSLYSRSSYRTTGQSHSLIRFHSRSINFATVYIQLSSVNINHVRPDRACFHIHCFNGSQDYVTIICSNVTRVQSYIFCSINANVSTLSVDRATINSYSVSNCVQGNARTFHG